MTTNDHELRNKKLTEISGGDFVEFPQNVGKKLTDV